VDESGEDLQNLAVAGGVKIESGGDVDGAHLEARARDALVLDAPSNGPSIDLARRSHASFLLSRYPVRYRIFIY